jgi:SAM-dependent methyltransferase
MMQHGTTGTAFNDGMASSADTVSNSSFIITPHTIVGFLSGVIWVHCAATAQTYSSRDPHLLHVLAAFSAPNTADTVIARLPETPGVGYLIHELSRIGALTVVDGLAVPEVPCNEDSVQDPTCDTEPPGHLVDAYLAPLAEGFDSLASTLGAIGPEVDESIRQATGIGLKPRLMACTNALLALRKAVDQRVPAWVQAQLQTLELPKRGLSIHLGSGSATLDGWVNIDVWPAPLSLDLRWGLPFEDESVERAYLSHTLEHFYYPGEVNCLLREIGRVMAPGGRIRVVVPDIEAAIHAYVNNDQRFFAGRRDSAWPKWETLTRLDSFLGYAGVGPRPGMFGAAHKFGYDFETLARCLADAGFREITRSTYQGSVDPTFNIDSLSSYAGANVDGRYYSLFVEAVA